MLLPHCLIVDKDHKTILVLGYVTLLRMINNNEGVLSGFDREITGTGTKLVDPKMVRRTRILPAAWSQSCLSIRSIFLMLLAAKKVESVSTLPEILFTAVAFFYTHTVTIFFL
jgi:hypothetical protein